MSPFGNEVTLIACRFCDQIYPNATTLMRHFLDNECINMPQFGNEPQNPNEVSFTVCQFCDQICSDATGLMRHFIYDKCEMMTVSRDGRSLIPRFEAYQNVINSVHLTVSFINKTQLFFINPCPRFHGLPPQNVPQNRYGFGQFFGLHSSNNPLLF